MDQVPPFRHCRTSREPESAAITQSGFSAPLRCARNQASAGTSGGPETSRRSSAAACRVHTRASTPRACRRTFTKGPGNLQSSLTNCEQLKILTNGTGPSSSLRTSTTGPACLRFGPVFHPTVRAGSTATGCPFQRPSAGRPAAGRPARSSRMSARVRLPGARE